jgi:hypothetical protein
MLPFPNPGPTKPAIYSPQAVWGFSAMFTPLVGGLLAHQALREAGQPTAGRRLLWQGIGLLAAYELLQYSLRWIFVYTARLNDPESVLRSLSNLVYSIPWWVFFGAAGYYLKREMEKLLPDVASYPRQPIGRPLKICLVVFGIPFLLFIGFVLLISQMGP